MSSRFMLLYCLYSLSLCSLHSVSPRDQTKDSTTTDSMNCNTFFTDFALFMKDNKCQ